MTHRILCYRWLRLAALVALCGIAALAQRVDVSSRPLQYERSRDYDVQHYRIQLSLDDAQRSFEGETTITLKPLRDRFEQLALDAETFTVDEVRDESGSLLAFQHGNGKLLIKLSAAAAYGETLQVRVRYHANGVQADPEQFGMVRGYDLGLAFKQATPNNPAVINTLSFPDGARHWFPCYDHPNDKATSEIVVTVREDYQVIANGRLAKVTANNRARTRTFRWLQEKPHSTYLFVLAAGPYKEVRDTQASIPISYWVYPGKEADARRIFGKTHDIIRFYEKEFGVPYPWAKYDQITIPGIGGGAESTSATVLGDVVIHEERADQDFPTGWLVAHEAAHQWWGNLVTMRDWTHTWVNEGFATYYDNAYVTAFEGEQEGDLDWLKKRDVYLEELRTKYRRPIVNPHWEAPNQNFDRHSYQKGALVLRMLRWVIGDAAFRRTIQHFLEKHAYQSADTHDLLVAIRESTGQVLDWFFYQWLYQSGHPVFSIASRWLPEESVLELSVTQTQQGDGVPAVFQLPVQIGIITASGRRSEKVWLRQREETFRFPLEEEPMLVRFNEGNHLLCEFEFEKSKEVLLFQLRHDDVTGRMWAARQLANMTEHASVLAALEQSATGDPFWGVRREALRATATFQDAALVAFWQQRAADAKSAVRVAAIQLLAARQDQALKNWFLERSRTDDSFLVRAEALRAIGSCGTPEDLAVLRAAATESSPRDVIRKAALDAIQAITRNQ